jgi:hypothetical protein
MAHHTSQYKKNQFPNLMCQILKGEDMEFALRTDKALKKLGW